MITSRDWANLLREYHRILAEQVTPMKLHNASERFLRKHGFIDKRDMFIRKPPMVGILLAHRARVGGDGSPASCDEALRKALTEIGQ